MKAFLPLATEALTSQGPIELITALQRPVRIPLQSWVADAEGKLDNMEINARLRVAENYEDLAKIYNQAALMVAFSGDASTARDVCRAQICLIQILTCGSNKAPFLSCAIQAWINLARLDRISGAYEAAAAKLNLLRDAMVLKPTSLADMSIDVQDWSALRQLRPKLDLFLHVVWYSETFSLLLRGHQFREVICLSTRNYGSIADDRLLSVFVEAALIAFCNFGEGTGDFRSRIDGLSIPDLHRLIIRLRIAQYDARWGESRFDAEAVDDLVRQVRALMACGAIGVGFLALTRALLDLLIKAGEKEAALDIAETAYRFSTALGDEVFRIQFASFIGFHRADVIWRDLCRELMGNTWYVGICEVGRYGGQLATGRSALDTLAHRLIGLPDKIKFAASAN
jgi:hypothetical protein